MKLKKMVALTLAGVMAASLSACGGGGGSAAPETKAAEGGEAPAEGGADAAASDTSGADIVLQVAFENSASEPVGEGWKKAQEIIKEKSGGTMAIEIYPESQLGDKSSLIDSMLLGENVHWLTAHSMRITGYRILVSCLGRFCSTVGISAGRWSSLTGIRNSARSWRKRALRSLPRTGFTVRGTL